MENAEHFGTLTERMKEFREEVLDEKPYIDAQKHPEKHKDLIVRVAGYSAFFNVLSKKTQDDIIGRTEQSLM